MTIKGRVTGGARTLRIEFKVSGGWLALSRTTSKADGTYTAQIPTNWYGTHQVRVSAPATASFRTATSDAQTVTVKPNYSPRGSSRSASPGNARWNPCAPINFKVNLRGAPKNSLQEVKSAFGKIRLASGLRFRYAGSTTKVPFARSKNNFEDGTIIIAWANESQVPHLRGNTVGVGGSGTVTRTRNGRAVREYVNGGVTLDVAAARRLRPGFGRGMTRGAVLMHEIGHTVGAGHVNSRSQVMYDVIHGDTIGRFGAGDIAALRSVGASKGCI